MVQPKYTVIAQCPYSGEQAKGFVKKLYKGSCLVSLKEPKTNKRRKVIFSSVDEAFKAATWGLDVVLGGYHDIHVFETKRAPEYSLASDWLLEKNDFNASN